MSFDFYSFLFQYLTQFSHSLARSTLKMSEFLSSNPQRRFGVDEIDGH